MSKVEILKQQLFKAIELVRGAIPWEDYDVILLVASLFKDGFISQDSFLNKPFDPNTIMDGKGVVGNDSKDEYEGIIHVFEDSLRRLNPEGVKILLDIFSSVDQDALKEFFPVLFDHVLYRIFESQGRFGVGSIQPRELSEIVVELVDLPKGAKVYNPFAGLASFNVFLPASVSYFGQELNDRTWALGMLRLKAYGRAEISDYTIGDSISEWPSPDKKFDLIISNPPYGLRIGGPFKTSEQFLISKGLESLSDSGKLVSVVPSNFLYGKGQESQIRERLIEEGLLEMVISLPGIMYNTNIPIALLVIKKSQKSDKSVTFIHAQDFVISSKSKEKKLDAERLIAEIKSGQSQSRTMVTVGVDSIRENNYNLNVPRYFRPLIEGVKLKEVLTYVEGSRTNLPAIGKLIKVRDLKDDNLDFHLDLNTIDDFKLSELSCRRVNESCLLIAAYWNSIKPTLFQHNERDIYLNTDILSFNINEDLVDPAFLINELHSDYVLKQVNSFRQGGAIPRIQRDDLLDIVIKIPSLEEQRAKVQGISELSERFKRLELEKNALTHGNSVSFRNEFASLKHTLGRPRQNILDWTDNIISFLIENLKEIEALDQKFKDFYETSILSALKEIKRDVNFMTDVLEKGENGLILKNFKKEIISLDTLNKIIDDFSLNGYNYQIIKHLLEGPGLDSRGVFVNKTLFKTLIDNILTNAHKYGFPIKDSANRLVIELSEDDDILQLNVRNNGAPFPKNYDREKFITKYSTADIENGSGLGGYDIHRIATYFQNPDWKLQLNQDPIFPVILSFQFPIILKN